MQLVLLASYSSRLSQCVNSDMRQQHGADVKLPVVLLDFAGKSDNLAGLILQDLLNAAIATVLDNHAVGGSRGERVDVFHGDRQAHSQVAEPRQLPKELVLLVADGMEGHPEVTVGVASDVVWPAGEVHQRLRTACLLPLHPILEQPAPQLQINFGASGAVSKEIPPRSR